MINALEEERTANRNRYPAPGGVPARKEDFVTQNHLTLENGAYAQASRVAGTQILQVFSDQHTLLFEYDAKQGKTRVNIESGDLEFLVRRGDIAFKSSQRVCFEGRSIEMQSRSDIRLNIINTLGKILSGLTVRPRRLKVQTPELHVTSQQGTFQIDKTKYSGHTVQGQIGHIKLVVQKIEVLAQNVITNAKNIYRTVTELTQLRTGRLRTLISSTYHMKSKNAYLNTEEDFKVKADQIHLG